MATVNFQYRPQATPAASVERRLRYPLAEWTDGPDGERVPPPPVPIRRVMAALPRTCGACGAALSGHELAKLPAEPGGPTLCDQCEQE